MEIKDALADITESYFGRSLLDTTKRPDIIIEFSSEKSARKYILLEVKYTEERDYLVSGLSQTLHYLYEVEREQQKIFGASLGNGYNAAVIAYKLPQGTARTGKLDQQNLKVKLFDFDDLMEGDALKAYLEKWIEKDS